MARPRTPKCPGCRYDLRGQLPVPPHAPGAACRLHTVCPECGEPVSWAHRSDRRSAWDRNPDADPIGWMILLVIVAVLALPCCLSVPLMAIASWASEAGW